ncbi:MBL fold metallo-hydrolase [Candidatus Peregrinibacteria bacterium CG10_big_fil_rev_8_21_14_0_10_55_24]|nr:MAG: MBL fold metallo-hydrolase [Candidatus Peregrinibacteria bacterium CG10_big_fil_rev_8_21_14_0_10_55_24]
MKIIPHGAAQEVTGTCHEICVESSAGAKRVLLDCGLFQGKRKEAAVKNATFSFDPSSDIDAVILTHAHMDHVGRIPLLYKKGYQGAVHCTYATRDLAEVMLQDSGYIQEKDEEYFRKHLKKSMIPYDGPLYTQQDALDCMKLFQGKNYGEWFPVCEGVRAQFLEAGHIVGAAMVVLEIVERGKTHRLGFTGDLGRSTLPIIRDPQPMPPVETLICESTYGNRPHEDISSAKQHLRDAVCQTAKRGGKVLIPAFSLERTQEIVYDLHLLWDAKEIPAVPIFIDSPLASRVTEVFMKHPECYDQQMYEQFLSRAHNPFQFSLVKFTESAEESKALNGMPGPMIIMAGSGMCEAGRIRHHLRNGIEDPKNTVLAVGYMAEQTLGRRIVDPNITEVKIFDRMYAKRAQVRYINAYSGHADMTDLDKLVRSVEGLKTVILVHGETDEMGPFAERIRHVRTVEVMMPEKEALVEL